MVIFPILGFAVTDTKCSGNFYNGTGFFVDTEGHFFTAGHNFYKPKERGADTLERLTCYALLKGKLLKIEDPYVEYDPDQEEVKCDFAYGKIDISFESLEVISLEVSSECRLLGYSRRNLPYEVKHSVRFKETEFYLYQVPIQKKDNILKVSEYVRYHYNNVIFYDADFDSLYGLSGCPVIENNQYIGILITRCFITREYAEKVFLENKSFLHPV
jgi:hypothetical protein